MIKRLFALFLFLINSGCIGFNSATGLKFKTGDDRVVKLKNDTFIDFERPIGNCGVKLTFFGIILPVIPIWYSSNSCEKSFDIAFTSIVNTDSGIKADLKLKYDGVFYDPVAVEKFTEFYFLQNRESKVQYSKKFKFQIPNFRKFRIANDKAIIVTGKSKDGKEFIEELSVKWGLIFYENPSIPSW